METALKQMNAFVSIIVFLECTIGDCLWQFNRYIATTIVLGSFLEKIHKTDMFYGEMIGVIELLR